MKETRLVRSDDRVIAGVCAGLAHYFGIDPVLMRLAFGIAFFAFGVGFLPYVILWIIMPEH